MPNAEQSGPSDSDIPKTVRLTEKDMQDAARLLRLLTDPALLGLPLPSTLPPAAVDDPQALVARARIVLGARRLRDQHFDRDLFGEPAWEMLLALYVAEGSGSRFTTGKLAEWIGVPLTTVVRWAKALEEKQLVGRTDHPTDRRIVFIRLLAKGKKALDEYLSAIPG